jgi:P2 family phage contractile tail tube protein
MALPRTLKNFNVFVDGVSFVGVATEVGLPKLSRKMEAYRAGGMNGEVDIDLGMEKLEIEHTYGGLVREMFQGFGLTRIDGMLLRFAGAYQRDDTGDVDAVEVTVRGRHQEIDTGNAKAGDKSELKVKSSLTYYKLTVNGQVDVEIDLVNMVENINGKDVLAAQRRAIGL